MGLISKWNLGLHQTTFGRIDKLDGSNHLKLDLLELTILDNPSCILQVTLKISLLSLFVGWSVLFKDLTSRKSEAF